MTSVISATGVRIILMLQYLYTQKIAPIIVIAALLFSSVLWVLNDQTVWAWDQALYGDWTIRLWHARLAGISAWLDDALHALGAQQPLMVWVGQFFVPLRHLTGNFESAILFTNICAAAAILALVYLILRRMGAGIVASLIAVVACGGSPLFIGLMHQYLVEMIQCFTATSMIFVAWRAERRSLLRTFSLSLLVTGLSFLSKASSATYVLPMIAYIMAVLLLDRRRAKPRSRPVDIVVLAAALIISCAAVAWYNDNWQVMVQHFKNATVGKGALYYGHAVNVVPKLQYWTRTLGLALSPFRIVSICIGLMIAAAVAVALTCLADRTPSERVQALIENGTLFALVLAGTVIATLVAYSLQINEDPRFLMPLIPMISVLVAWSLATVRNQVVLGLFLIGLAANAATNHAYAHGSDPFHITALYGSPVHHSADDRLLLTRAVRSTCKPDVGNQTILFAVNYSTLNGSSANFYSRKDSYVTGRYCHYDNVVYGEKDIQLALDGITTRSPPYIVTVALDKQRSPDFMNALSRPIAEFLANDPRYALAAGSEPYLLIYQRIRPPK